jgi:hypothetical protein
LVAQRRTARYAVPMIAVRLVYFILDPYTGAREVVAAQVREGASARVVRAPAPDLPPAARGAVARALVELEAEPAFEALPIGAGPQLVVTEPRVIPTAWALDALLRPVA